MSNCATYLYSGLPDFQVRSPAGLLPNYNKFPTLGKAEINFCKDESKQNDSNETKYKGKFEMFVSTVHTQLTSDLSSCFFFSFFFLSFLSFSHKSHFSSSASSKALIAKFIIAWMELNISDTREVSRQLYITSHTTSFSASRNGLLANKQNIYMRGRYKGLYNEL